MNNITTSINSILKNLIKNFNTLLDCPERFSGEYGDNKVHNFIEYVEYYKRVKCIADEQAMQELQYLLLDQAHNWWLRRKSNINTWSEALTVLESHYSRRRLPHIVYSEILKHNYGEYENKDDFIDDKIELFSQLPQPELEETKLNIVYALLPNDIQNKIELVNINNIKDLKEQLKLINLDCTVTTTTNDNSISNLRTIVEANKESNEVQNLNGCNIESVNLTTVNKEINVGNEKDPIIKVKRTQDLMPQNVNIKEEEETPNEQREFISHKNSINTNTLSETIQDDFEIDTDIMNQINNIIDESEMNLRSLNTHNDNTLPTAAEPTNDITTLELLGFDINTNIQEKVSSKKSVDQPKKARLKGTNRVRIRCSYCRHFNHTAQTCFKRAKHIKLFPEKFLPLEIKKNENISKPQSKKEPMETLPISNTSSSANHTNTSSTETITTPPILNQILTTSSPLTALPAVASSPTVALNNVLEKCVRPNLTTKLYEPVNGKITQKLLGSKLRSANLPSTKCHQCGTVGFYKSICPNCSPIYNNNNQYTK